MTIEQLEQKLNSLNSDIKCILKESGFDQYDDLSALEGYDCIKINEDKLQLLDESMTTLYRLQGVSDTLEYFKRPIKAEGYLVKQENGRYLLNGRELSSGYGIEWLCTTDDRYYNFDEDKCYPYWKASRIEHNGNDYYIVGCKEEPGAVKVRIR